MRRTYCVTLFAFTTRSARSSVSWANCSTYACPAVSSRIASSVAYSDFVCRVACQPRKESGLGWFANLLQLVHQAHRVLQHIFACLMEPPRKNLVDDPVFACRCQYLPVSTLEAVHTPISHDRLDCLQLHCLGRTFPEVDVGLLQRGRYAVGHGRQAGLYVETGFWRCKESKMLVIVANSCLLVPQSRPDRFEDAAFVISSPRLDHRPGLTTAHRQQRRGRELGPDCGWSLHYGAQISGAFDIAGNVALAYEQWACRNVFFCRRWKVASFCVPPTTRLFQREGTPDKIYTRFLS